MGINQVRDLLKDKGYKFTPQRRALVEALLSFKHPATAKNLYDHLSDKLPDLSQDTVYRTLKVLCDLGVVSTIQHPGKEGAQYELSGKPHHHHLVCLECGQSVCLSYCPMDEFSQTVAEKEKFQIIGHTFEIFGYCQECQGQ